MDADLNNLLVLAGLAAVLTAAVVAYLLAWRSKRIAVRTAGSLASAIIMGAAGLFFFMWVVLMAQSISSHEEPSVRWTLVLLLVFLSASMGAFFLSAKFARQALRDWHLQQEK